MGNLAISVNYNVAETVDELMKKQFQFRRLQQMQATKNVEQTQINAYGSLKNLFTAFQTQLTNLNSAFNAVAYQATSSNSTVVSGVSVKSNATGTGTHAVHVTQLAQSQQFMSANQFTSNNSQLNINETITFTNSVNSQNTLSLQIKPTDTLENIRDNINNASGAVGVSAAIVSSTSGGGAPMYNLVITSGMGASNQVNITGDTAFSFSQTSAGLDAQFTFDNLNVTRSSNNIDDVLDGLSFSVSALGDASIIITSGGNDVKGGVTTAVQNMLTSYNQIINFLDANRIVGYYDDKNNVHATSYNDAFSLIKSQFQSAMNTGFNSTGDIHLLRDVGIILNSSAQEVVDQYDRDRKFNSFGSLLVDPTAQQAFGGSTTFQYKLNNDFNAMRDFFTNSASGLITSLNNTINNSINSSGSTGIISNATGSIEQMQKNTDTQMDAERKRLDSVRDTLLERFIKLNGTISYYQGISDYLDKQNAYLSNLIKTK